MTENLVCYLGKVKGYRNCGECYGKEVCVFYEEKRTPGVPDKNV